MLNSLSVLFTITLRLNERLRWSENPQWCEYKYKCVFASMTPKQ